MKNLIIFGTLLLAMVIVLGCTSSETIKCNNPDGNVGDTRMADDGCNSCECNNQGNWACTELACTPTPPSFPD